MTPAAAASVLPYRAPPPPPPPPRRAVDEPWTPGRLFLRKLGFQIAAFGVLALILPLFGLQFTKLSKLGDAAWIAGASMIVIGAIMVGLAYGGRRAAMILLIGVPVLLIVGFGLFLMVGTMLRPRRVAVPAPPAAVPATPFVPARRPPPPMANPAVPPSGFGPGQVPPRGSTSRPTTTQPGGGARASIVRQFGENRVVEVRVVGIADPRQRVMVQRKLMDLMRRLTPGGPWRAATLIPPPPDLNGAAAFVVGPVDDPAAFAGAIDFGTATADARKRTVTITVDPATLAPPVRRP